MCTAGAIYFQEQSLTKNQKRSFWELCLNSPSIIDSRRGVVRREPQTSTSITLLLIKKKKTPQKSPIWKKTPCKCNGYSSKKRKSAQKTIPTAMASPFSLDVELNFENIKNTHTQTEEQTQLQCMQIWFEMISSRFRILSGCPCILVSLCDSVKH